MAATFVTFFAAVIVGWLKGGHPERFGATVFVLTYLALGPAQRWTIGDIYIDTAISDSLLLLFLGWLALRSDRWWPFVLTAATALTLLVHICTVVTDISWAAAVSARVGLDLLANLALLAGVVERWLAGERPASEGQQWRRRVGAAP